MSSEIMRKDRRVLPTGKAQMKPMVEVVQRPESEVPKEILAEAIVRISKDMAKLHESGLNRKAVVALIKDSTGYTKQAIETVLNSLAELRANYCR